MLCKAQISKVMEYRKSRIWYRFKIYLYIEKYLGNFEITVFVYSVDF